MKRICRQIAAVNTLATSWLLSPSSVATNTYGSSDFLTPSCSLSSPLHGPARSSHSDRETHYSCGLDRSAGGGGGGGGAKWRGSAHRPSNLCQQWSSSLHILTASHSPENHWLKTHKQSHTSTRSHEPMLDIISVPAHVFWYFKYGILVSCL